MSKLKYRRVILKLSGDIFSGDQGSGIDFEEVNKVAQKIITIKNTGVQLGVTLGGGNIARGRNIAELKRHGIGIEQMVLHNMGMLGSVLNGLALLGVFESKGVGSELLSRIKISGFVQLYGRSKAFNYLEEGKIVIFAGGLGRAFFTHDTAVAQLSLELNCEILLKGTTVDGVYDKDPEKYKKAKRYEEVSFKEALEKDLKIMDSTAFALCQRYNLPIVVFNIDEEDAVKRILYGEKVGTLVKKRV